MYRAKFRFEGQEGEMSLEKGDEVELVSKGDDGWWLVKRDGVEAWAPYNYLEEIAPRAAPAPPPPPARPRPTSTVPKATVASVAADASAKPVSVFPGMAPANGGATPWKKPAAAAAAASTARVPPPVGKKPKPPVVAPKPGAKPALPTTARPTAAAGGGAGRGGAPGAPGQMDLAAALARRAQRIAEE